MYESASMAERFWEAAATLSCRDCESLPRATGNYGSSQRTAGVGERSATAGSCGSGIRVKLEELEAAGLEARNGGRLAHWRGRSTCGR